MRVNREDFLRALARVSPGLSLKKAAEQSMSFCFIGGYVVASDRQRVWCRGRSGLLDSVNTSVAAKQLVGVLRRLPDEFVDIDLKDKHLVVKAGDDRVKFKGAEPMLEADLGFTPQTPWKELDESFSDAVELVRDCAGGDSERQWIATTIHVTPKYVEACDGVQACRYRLPVPVSGHCVVEQATFRDVVAAGLTEMAEEGPWLHLRSPDGFNMSFRRHAEAYPGLGAYYCVEGDTLELPKSLADVIDMAEQFSKEDADNNRLLVRLTEDEVSVTGSGSAGEATFVRPCRFEGRPVSFFAPVKILKGVLERSAECVVNETRLMIDGGDRWRFICSLQAPEGK